MATRRPCCGGSLDLDLQVAARRVSRFWAKPRRRRWRESRLLSEALRPADTTDRWSLIEPQERIALSVAGCEGLALIEAADEREEALATAIALRETLEEPGRTAALVTPDRSSPSGSPPN